MNICCRLILLISVIVNMASRKLSGNEEVKHMANSNTRFSFDLLRKCGADAKGKSIFFAPYSITTALAMTYLGACGETAEEMKQVLKWSHDIPRNGFGSYLPLLNEAAMEKSPGYILVGAQRVYVNGRLSLMSEFSSETQKHFASQAETANFGTDPEGERNKINSWVLEQTRNKIRDLLPGGSIDPLTAMVLVQALYFKGNWMHKFRAEATKQADFFTPQGTVKVNMMMQKRDFNYVINDELDCSAVELPYASNNSSARAHDLSMLILLPNAKDGLDKLESALTLESLEKLRSRMCSVEVDLKLPRFTVESSFQLKDVLTSLGMKRAFTDRADFSGMINEPKELKVSQVFHKAVVEVNEEGSEAAAATAVVMMTRCMRISMPFVADHPFLFFIMDNRADVVLFSGRLVSPHAVAPKAQKEDL